jgi:hypothetical protein
MAAQQPNPLLQALRSHGTSFFLFIMICADLLAAVLSFVYGAWVGSWILAFLHWMLTWKAFPTPIPLRLWPLWQYTGLLWGGGYLFTTHHTRRYPRPDVNVKTKRIPVPVDTQESEAPPLPEPPLFETIVDLFGSPKRQVIVDAPPATQPMPREQGYRIETRIFPLSLIHQHAEKWETLERYYHEYRDALTRFRTHPLRKLTIPPQAYYYESIGHIGWQHHELVIPERLFHPKNKELLPGYLAHELAFRQQSDLWLRDLLSHYANDTFEQWAGILVGDFQALPTTIKVWYMPRWEYDRTKDGDIFAYLLGQGPLLKRHFQRLIEKEKPMPSSATLNTESPTLSERIGQLEGLINHEYEQMRSYGLEPPQETPLWPDEQPHLPQNTSTLL